MRQLRYKRNRGRTFGIFPIAPMVNCIKLSSNGLFFTSIDAVVECYNCRERHGDWHTNDELYHDKIHHHIPRCSFLGASGFPLRNAFSSVRFTHGMQGEGDTIRFFHCNVGLRNWLAGDDPWAEHARFSFEFTFLKINIMQAVETVENSPVQVNRRGNNYYNEKLERLKAENENLRRSMACIICKEREAVVLFLPCTHLITCLECAPKFGKCPICGTDIEGVIRVFRA
ncbi:baculoviral IAP repeat-containing protein 3-like [Mya arenaria]|uniref:baculoviral IAP repeat-containing protein 3-like n=1 Tax=Mya arenaria TaxID=6604 RepID=UPI0022E2F930|nr:baculoviral IAP repeat-containing protein 3-like [Mya arenaria]